MNRHAHARRRAPRGFLQALKQQVVKRTLIVGTGRRYQLWARERGVEPPLRPVVIIVHTDACRIGRVGVAMDEGGGMMIVVVRLVEMFRRQQRLGEHAQHGKTCHRPLDHAPDIHQLIMGVVIRRVNQLTVPLAANRQGDHTDTARCVVLIHTSR